MNWRCFFLLIVGLLCTDGAAAAATTEMTTVLERAPHSQVVQTVSPAVDEQGNAVSVTNTFTQLQTGLNRWSEADGGWVPALEQIERVNGTLLARQTQHLVKGFLFRRWAATIFKPATAPSSCATSERPISVRLCWRA